MNKEAIREEEEKVELGGGKVKETNSDPVLDVRLLLQDKNSGMNNEEGHIKEILNELSETEDEEDPVLDGRLLFDNKITDQTKDYTTDDEKYFEEEVENDPVLDARLLFQKLNLLVDLPDNSI